MILIIMTAIFFIILSLAILCEKREYNNGICKCCGKKLRLFDIDSQGGRLYTCEDTHTSVSVSYDCVDKNKSMYEDLKYWRERCHGAETDVTTLNSKVETLKNKNTKLKQAISDQEITIKALLITIKEMCKEDETNE